MKKETSTKGACCSTRQKIWGAIALAGLFACGVMIGVGFGSADGNKLHKKQCNAIAAKIVEISNWNSFEQEDIDRLKELNAMYEQVCAGYVADIDAVSRGDLPGNIDDIRACEVIEKVLLERLRPIESNWIKAHIDNIGIYKSLVESGCPENEARYNEMIERETSIMNAIKDALPNENTHACAEIEDLLIQQLPNKDMNSSDTRIERAKIYANLSERGCAENADTYVELAAKELEVARALSDDKFSEPEAVEVVETYKRLEMKQAANEVFQKVQKLTDPAIDFILQVQKIIEE